MGLGALQPGHLIVVLVIVLLIFGPGKLPELGKSLGEGMRELKKATSGDDVDKPSAPATASTVAAVPASTAPVAASTTPLVAGRVCPSCNNGVSSNDKFCGHCGAALSPAARVM